MNNDLISREALKKALEPYRFAMCGFEGVLFLIDNAPAVENMNPDYQIKVNIPEEETHKLIKQLQRWRPCILPEFEFTDDDIQELIKENFNIGYEMAKNKYARPQGEWICKTKSTFPQYQPDEYKCPFCGHIENRKTKYCCNCGADMRKGGAV